ncbi:hypothetical protein BpHYR1_051869 [Brachionus plicatilis]|uniref:Uncharacterized protein n=1 Tax=Brachionus plicatilis TaxID=10195 RepID=A0A3M7RFC1_BRAPC|nr:hypothetical protein BpHYR1_051869 [Brachionus plicatilis]
MIIFYEKITLNKILNFEFQFNPSLILIYFFAVVGLSKSISTFLFELKFEILDSKAEIYI